MTRLLNAPQHRSLAITLRIFEEALRQADAWLQGTPDEGTLYRRVLNLKADTRAEARQRIAAGLTQIAELAEEFDLEQQEQDLRTAIAAAMSLSWANLCDTGSKKLRCYGQVDPGLAEVLDPPIERLAELALSLASMLRSDDASV